MSNFLINDEVEIDPLNSCLNDYNRFIILPTHELDTIQKNHFTELHKLQAEMDTLLDELRTLAKIPASNTYLHCA
jgi:hypothetical protein